MLNTTVSKMPNNVILSSVVGSVAYGLAHENSDIDTLGIFIAPNTALLGLHWNTHKETVVFKDPEPDATYHEVGKFVRLALKCNPTITELLYMDEYLKKDWHGNILIENRAKFLSTKYVRSAYGEYARQQVDRLIKRGDTFSSKTQHRTAKHGRHCFRLLFQAYDLLTTGTLNVRLTEGQAVACKYMGALAETDVDKFVREFEAMDKMVRDVESVLPDEPDITTVNEILLYIRGLI